jgi:Mg/Co/Ni transporter MgtE
MTTLVTRARLLSTVLRTGDVRRIRRLVDRLDPRGLAGVLPALDHLDLRRMAAALCDEDRVDRTVDTLEAEALARLALAASADDLARLLTALSRAEKRVAATALLALPGEARALALSSLDEVTRKQLIRTLPRRARPKTGDNGLVAALRLRRLFA